MDTILGLIIIFGIVAFIVYRILSDLGAPDTYEKLCEEKRQKELEKQKAKAEELAKRREEIERSPMLRVDKIWAIHHLSNPYSCPLCGGGSYTDRPEPCSKCLLEYEEDIRDGVIKEGLTKETYDLTTWKKFRLLEREVREGRMTYQAAMEEERVLITRAQQAPARLEAEREERARKAKEATERRRSQYL